MTTLVHHELRSQLTSPVSSEPQQSVWTWLVYVALFCLLIVGRITAVHANVVLTSGSPRVHAVDPAPFKPTAAWPPYTSVTASLDSEAAVLLMD
ncbi:MAG TPA: hypothetical protein VK364_02505 [Hymenobacter sp.]|nr:hypothetical protein [Hymenobacter sp.]